MSVGSDWMTRVDQLTAATLHEQLRTVVREAQELLERFNSASWEQGGLLLDAQRELEATFTSRIAQVSEELSASIAALREQMSERRPENPSADLGSFRSEVFTSLAAFGEELDAETKRLRDELTARIDGIAATLASMQHAQTQLEERVASAVASSEARLGAIAEQLHGIAGMEERAAARMVELLASAFARLRDERSASVLLSG